MGPLVFSSTDTSVEEPGAREAMLRAMEAGVTPKLFLFSWRENFFFYQVGIIYLFCKKNSYKEKNVFLQTLEIKNI